MKKLSTLICALLLCVCFILSGCSMPLTMPSGEIKSNGGSAVVVGDYVYYANAYVSASSLKTGDNDEARVEHNSIYRVKTENGKTVKDERDNVQNIEKAIAKIAGFETSNMFAKGDYLYFTSPNAHKSSVEGEEGKDRFDLTTLFRCKLDGTGLKEILTTQTTAGKFYLAKQGDKDVLFVFDDGKIQQLEIGDKLTEIKTLVEDVTDTVFPQEFGASLSTLFYTKALPEQQQNDGLTGNILYRYNIEDAKSTAVYQKNKETVTLVAYDTNRLYYTRNNDYYSNSLKEGKGFEVDEVQHTYVGDTTKITEFYSFGTSDNGDVLPVVYVFNSKMFIQTTTANPTVFHNAAVTVEFISGEYVFFSTESGIYRKSYKTPNQDAVQLTDKSDIKTGTADFDGKYVYFYAKAENNSTDTYYMHRANLTTAVRGEMKTECISYVLADDLVEDAE
ncbi:MAG: hypothetical protein IJA69_06000 [Clostridia bacterium]|nr:hypothetical protein [Clostridia bacterium]